MKSLGNPECSVGEMGEMGEVRVRIFFSQQSKNCQADSEFRKGEGEIQRERREMRM
jgi:hypothetical protein